MLKNLAKLDQTEMDKVNVDLAARKSSNESVEGIASRICVRKASGK